MPAGPFPTKVMHEALKSRVDTLEGAGPSSGGETLPLLPSLLSLSGPASTATNVKTIVLTWRHRSVNVKTIRLQGHWTLAQFDLVTLRKGADPYSPYLWEWPSEPDAAVTATQLTVNGTDYTDLTLDREYTVTDGGLNIQFSAVSPLMCQDANFESRIGVSAEVWDENGSAIPSKYPMVSIYGTRQPQFALTPEPTAPQSYGDRQALVEMVWPLGGVPYLHVAQYDGEEGPLDYHVPLTLGLPV